MAVLFFAVLFFAVLFFAVLFFAVVFFAVLFFAVLFFAGLASAARVTDDGPGPGLLAPRARPTAAHRPAVASAPAGRPRPRSSAVSASPV